MGSARTTTVNTSANNTFVIPSKPNEFWGRLGIFPDAYDGGEAGFGGTVEAKILLSALGSGNLGMLCERFKITIPKDADRSNLATAFLTKADPLTVLHLAEFMKRRIDWIEKCFEDKFGNSGQRKIESAVSQHSPRRPEKLKAFTKLLLLFNKKQTALLDVFGLESWHGHSTSFEYSVSGSDKFATFVNRNISGIEKSFGKVTKHGVKLLCKHVLPDRRNIWVFLREYAPKVKRDYRSDYNVAHECGMIVFGFDPSDNRVHFKSSNKQLAEAFSETTEESFDGQLTLLKNLVFSDYIPEQVSRNFCGDYSEEHDVFLQEIAFGRTGLPDGSGFAIKRGFMKRSVKQDLQILSNEDNGYLSVSGPGDIEELEVDFLGQVARIKLERDKGGAFRFTFDNKGWDKKQQTNFESSFREAFGVPLNRLIDPSVVPMGSASIIASLLSQKNFANVAPYQEDELRYLLDAGYLKSETHSLRGCVNNFCSETKKIVTDESRQRCVKCSKQLGSWNANMLEPAQSKLIRLVARFFDDSGFELQITPKKIESVSYYQLRQRTDDGEGVRLAVVVANHPTPAVRQTFERASLPLIVLQPSTFSKPVYVDFDNVGHISLANLIASEQQSLSETLMKQCGELASKMALTHNEAIQKAARHSRKILTEGTASLTGNQYEIEIFNLLRIIFPYSFQLGRVGKEEPDGFVSIPDYSDIESLEDVNSFNFSYDAKYSEAKKGYDFGSIERRQMIDYIGRFSRKKHVLGRNNTKYHAHVIVSNNLQNEKLSAAAKFAYGEDGLKGKARQVRLVLMRQAYILSLFDWVQSNPNEFMEKRAYLYEAIIKQLQMDTAEKFVELDSEQAEQVIDSVKKLEVYETRISRTNLERSLDDEDALVK